MSTDRELVAPFNHRFVLSDEEDEYEDDTDRLSELIALAEAGLQA